MERVGGIKHAIPGIVASLKHAWYGCPIANLTPRIGLFGKESTLISWCTVCGAEHFSTEHQHA